MSWNALYALDVLALALFALSYYRKCYRRGYRIDFWHAQLFLYCVLPNMVMLPFAKSELNILVLGKDLAAVTAVLPIVFLITLIGYAAVLLGSALWRLQAGLGLRRDAAHILEIVPRCSMMLMSARGVLIFQAGLCFVLQLAILARYFSAGGLAFDLRSYTFENPTLRPIALVISNYSIVIASHCLARYVDTKERILLLCTLGLTLGLVFFGARGNLVAIYISVLLCYFVRLREQGRLVSNREPDLCNNRCRILFRECTRWRLLSGRILYIVHHTSVLRKHLFRPPRFCLGIFRVGSRVLGRQNLSRGHHVLCSALRIPFPGHVGHGCGHCVNGRF